MEKALLWLILFPLGWALVDGSEAEQDVMWHLRKVPRVVSERTFHLPSPTFEADAKMVLRSVCGIECQQGRPAPSLSDLEDALSYETVFENGTRTLTRVKVHGLAPEPTHNLTARGRSARRSKRQVYGTDSRFSILGRRFLTTFPFNTAVKLSTGCSGVLVSPRHVLTAAHCVHDGRGYVKGSRRLRVGLLKTRHQGAGKKRGGPRRSRREAAGGGGPAEGGRETRAGRAEAGRSGRHRAGGQRGAGGGPAFRWTRVQHTHVPRGWAAAAAAAAALDYDYAVLELKRAPGKRYLELGVSPALGQRPGGRIHFSGFDRDRADQLVYRFCSVSEESSDLLYQHCDAEPGSTGSGVYLRLKEPGQSWKRKVIAVYSGHQRADVHGVQKDYNVAVRLTPLKFAQICRWVRGEDAGCTYG